MVRSPSYAFVDGKTAASCRLGDVVEDRPTFTAFFTLKRLYIASRCSPSWEDAVGARPDARRRPRSTARSRPSLRERASGAAPWMRSPRRCAHPRRLDAVGAIPAATPVPCPGRMATQRLAPTCVLSASPPAPNLMSDFVRRSALHVEAAGRRKPRVPRPSAAAESHTSVMRADVG